MADNARVLTVKLPAELVARLDEISERIDRSRSWIARQALAEWLAEEQRRHDLTLEALADFDAGRTLSQEEVERHLKQRREQRASRDKA